MNTSEDTRTQGWRRRTLLGAYAALVLAVILLRGSDPLVLVLYRVTLPLSALSFGATSEVFGWLLIVLGVLFNSLILYVVGGALDRRANPRRAA
jgi:hypothetical protein